MLYTVPLHDLWFTGTVSFAASASAAVEVTGSIGYCVGPLFLLGALLQDFAVPFHMWNADVYECAPTCARSRLPAEWSQRLRCSARGASPLPVILRQMCSRIVVFVSIASVALGSFLPPSAHKKASDPDGLFLDRHMGFCLVGWLQHGDARSRARLDRDPMCR